MIVNTYIVLLLKVEILDYHLMARLSICMEQSVLATTNTEIKQYTFIFIVTT